MSKLIITAAICGAEVTKEHNPHIPYTIKEIQAEAKRAYDAGASIIHLHVRTDDGQPTQEAHRFAQAMEAIYESCPDVIIQPSTGGAAGMTAMERGQPLILYPEMATIDCGTLNFGPDEIFVNKESLIKDFARTMEDQGCLPELECFDQGMVDTVLRLRHKGYFNHHLHFSFVLGVHGGMSATIRNFSFMRHSLPREATYSVAGIGRYEFPMACAAIIDGGHVRVGFEDNIYISKGVVANSNGQLVEKVVRLSQELGREIASPNEARELLSIRKKNQRKEEVS